MTTNGHVNLLYFGDTSGDNLSIGEREPTYCYPEDISYLETIHIEEYELHPIR